MLILGIETSCDETAIAVVEDGRYVHANVIASQLDIHARYGGVVPEVASREHVHAFLPTLTEALRQAGATLGDVDLVAVTHEPGLVGSLLVGAAGAKGLALAAGLPLLGVHHLEGHVYANWLGDDRAAPAAAEPEFPLVCLIVSGGHTEIVLMREHGLFERLGSTRDDAAGEAFDKVARLLGLGFPGGPAIERAAQAGRPDAYPVPRAWLGDSLDFSFSGVKTAMLRLVESEQPGLDQATIANLAASFQSSVIDVLVTKTLQAADATGARQVLLSGGVAANRPLLQAFIDRSALPVLCPPPRHCTDNGAMIASAAYYRFLAGERSDMQLDVRAVAPIPLRATA